MTPKSALVRNYMSGSLVTFGPETDILDAIHELLRHRIAGAPVVDDLGNIVGMLSELDCMKIALSAGYHDERGGPVKDYMTTEAETVDAEMSIIDLAQLFLDSGFRRYPVLKDNRLIGQISRRDVLRALAEIAATGS